MDNTWKKKKEVMTPFRFPLTLLSNIIHFSNHNSPIQDSVIAELQEWFPT